MSVAFSPSEGSATKQSFTRGAHRRLVRKIATSNQLGAGHATTIDRRSNELNNPHAQMRCQLIQDGFEESEIDTACEEMWNRELPYDEYTAVLSYIRSRHAVKEIKERHENLQQCPPEEETKTASTAESTSTSLKESQICDEEKDNADSSSELVERSQFSEDTDELHLTRQKKSSVQPLNIASKLDLVADYENLADAAFALSEWVAKAAGREEIQELCSAQKSRALPTVMRRTIAQTVDQVKFEESVLPSILHLIGSIFLNAGMSSTAASATRKSLESVMHQARKASLQKRDSEQVFADRVGRYIVSRISAAIQDLKCHNNDEGVDLILRLEDEIESLASSLATHEKGGVVELITKRDANKLAAEKSSTVVGVAMATTFRGFEMPDDVDDGSVDKQDILIRLVGKAGMDRMQANKRSYDELETKVTSLESNNLEESSRLKSNLETYRAERGLVAERMAELRLAMKQLEEDDAELQQKIVATEEKISVVDSSCTEEVGKLSENLGETKKIVDLETTIDDLAGGLKVYEESLKKAVTVSNIFESCENVDDFVPNKLGVYLVHVKNYLTSESECIGFLRSRARNVEREARDLEREIQECKALGMTATVSQLSDALALNRQNAIDDKDVIDGLVVEAQNMLMSVIGRLDQYVSDESIQRRSYDLSPLHITLVRGIAGTVEMLGLEDIDRLKGFLANSNDDPPTLVTTSNDENDDDNASSDLELEETEVEEDENTVDDLETIDRSESIQLSAATTAPTDESSDNVASSKSTSGMPDMLVRKLNWANPLAKPFKPTVKSLLDIQKEELSRGSDQTNSS